MSTALQRRTGALDMQKRYRLSPCRKERRSTAKAICALTSPSWGGKWLSTDDSVRTFVFEAMAARLTEVKTLAVEIGVSRMDVRLASLLLRLADLHRDRTVRLTHDELAAELGTAREVVSRLLKEFERGGALRLGRGHFAIVDPSLLADLAASGGVRASG